MKKLFFFILASLIASPVCAMSFPKQKALDLRMQTIPEFGKVTLQCEDGHLVVDNTKLAKLKTLYDIYMDCTDDRSIPVDAKVDVIKNLLQDTITIPKDTNQLIELFLAADKYEASKSVLQKLADHVDNIIDHQKNPDLSLLILFHKKRSLETLQRLHQLKFTIELGELILADNNLESLDGIEKIFKSSLYKKISTMMVGSGKIPEWQILELKLDGNKLRSLNPALLKQLFPNLWRITAKNNQIEELDLSTIPDDLILDLSHNQIRKIIRPVGYFYNTPQACSIDLSDNNLSTSELIKLQVMSPWQRLKQRTVKAGILISLVSNLGIMTTSFYRSFNMLLHRNTNSGIKNGLIFIGSTAMIYPLAYICGKILIANTFIESNVYNNQKPDEDVQSS